MCQEAVGISQVGGDGGSGNGLAVGMGLGCVLGSEPIRFADGLGVGVKY